MEQIIKVTANILRQISGITTQEVYYFFGMDSAKRWCKNDTKKRKGKWVKYNDIVTYDLDPITITVLDEDDGEV